MRSPVFLYKISRKISQFGIPVLPSMLDYLIRLIYCCWLPHTVRMGDGVILGYGGMGIVIHKDVRIGSRVHIDQHVTIGGNARVFGVPTLGNDIYIGAGAKILGPIHIGDGVVIGANAVVVTDIPPNSPAVGLPARVKKSNIVFSDYV